MGRFLNPGNGAFADVLGSKIYVDKSGLLEYTNDKRIMYIIRMLLYPFCFRESFRVTGHKQELMNQYCH
ncbi:MAG TPA: hypothetical protein DD387_04720 [Lachnoclostridium sp.]|nr:hypothetical protein [Lachnoclostridium sp.]